MKIGCVYTVERGATDEVPLPYATDIPFGMAIISTLLKDAGHDVRLLVFSARSNYRRILEDYIREQRPRLFCLTAVSSQFAFIREIARIIKHTDPSIFVALGGHHASLDSDEAIETPTLDAICVGEGDYAVLELARQLEAGGGVSGIPNMWIKRPDGPLEKNPAVDFEQDLDSLPFIDRKLWEPWIVNPDKYPHVLLGRGCPFRCTYCSAHAMRGLQSGKFVRFRSVSNIVAEIEKICVDYPAVDSIYLEVETIAHQKEAVALFEGLAAFNRGRDVPLSFGCNFTVTSQFIRREEGCREFLAMLERANVTYLNIGLESGSERLRKDVLRRPRYTNDEFVRFAQMAREFEIDLDFYVLIGVPDETLEDYRETVRLVRETQPKTVQLSIFYPYLGTDLATLALDRGLVTRRDLDPTLDAGDESEALRKAMERTRPALNVPTFPRWRVRLEYTLFWFKVYRGHWPASQILVQSILGFIVGNPRLWAMYNRLQDHSRVVNFLREIYRSRLHRGSNPRDVHRPQQIHATYD